MADRRRGQRASQQPGGQRGSQRGGQSSSRNDTQRGAQRGAQRGSQRGARGRGGDGNASTDLTVRGRGARGWAGASAVRQRDQLSQANAPHGQVLYNNSFISLNDAFREIENLAASDARDNHVQARHLLETVHNVLNPILNNVGEWAGRFSDIFVQHQNIFRDLANTVRPTVERGQQHRSNEMRTQQGKDRLTQSGWATKFHVDIFLPRLTGDYPGQLSRNFVEDLNNIMLQRHDFFHLLNVAQRAFQYRLRKAIAAEESAAAKAGRTSSFGHSPFMRPEDFRMINRSDEEKRKRTISDFLNDREGRAAIKNYPQFDKWEYLNGFLIPRGDKQDFSLIKETIEKARATTAAPPPHFASPTGTGASTHPPAPETPSKTRHFVPLDDETEPSSPEKKRKTTKTTGGETQSKTAKVKPMKKPVLKTPAPTDEDRRLKLTTDLLAALTDTYSDPGLYKKTPTTKPEVEAALSSGTMAIPLKNPSEFQKRLWSWIIDALKAIQTQGFQAIDYNIIKFGENVNSSEQIAQCKQLARAVTELTTNAYVALVLHTWIGALRAYVLGQQEHYTGMAYVEAVRDWLADIVRQRRQQLGRGTGENFMIGEDLFDANLATGRFTPIQINTTTIEDLLVTGRSRLRPTGVWSALEEHEDGWLGDDTLTNILRFQAPGAQNQTTYIMPPSIVHQLIGPQLAARDSNNPMTQEQADQEVDTYIRRGNIALPAADFAGNIVMPINFGDHWSLIYIRRMDQHGNRTTEDEIFYLDSMGEPMRGPFVARAINRWLNHDVMAYAFGYRSQRWMTDTRSARQTNARDCGIAVIENALALDRGLSLPNEINGDERRVAYAANIMQAIQHYANVIPPAARDNAPTRPLAAPLTAQDINRLAPAATIAPSTQDPKIKTAEQRARSTGSPGLNIYRKRHFGRLPIEDIATQLHKMRISTRPTMASPSPPRTPVSISSGVPSPKSVGTPPGFSLDTPGKPTSIGSPSTGDSRQRGFSDTGINPSIAERLRSNTGAPTQTSPHSTSSPGHSHASRFRSRHASPSAMSGPIDRQPRVEDEEDDVKGKGKAKEK